MENWVKKSVIDFYENVLGKEEGGQAYEDMKKNQPSGHKKALNAIGTNRTTSSEESNELSTLLDDTISFGDAQHLQQRCA